MRRTSNGVGGSASPSPSRSSSTPRRCEQAARQQRTICPPSNRPHRNRVPTRLVGEGPERRRPRPTSRAACPVDELAATVNLPPPGSVWRGVVCPNYLVTFVASSLTIGFDAFIVDLMSQSRDFAPMGDDEAGERRWGQWRGEVLAPSGELAPCLRRDRSGRLLLHLSLALDDASPAHSPGFPLIRCGLRTLAGAGPEPASR